MSASPTSLVARERRAWSIRTSFLLVVAAQTLLPAASNFPTPLFPLYERQYGFGSGMVTALFAVYVMSLIPALLVLGQFVDRIGRRPFLVAGTAISMVSSVAFASAHGVAWLFAGEIIYGVAAGLVVGCASVTIRELHPTQSVARGALAATAAASSGLALGPLVSGLLATVTPWPTVAPYALDIVLAGLLAVVLLRIPETKPHHPTRAERLPVFHVPAEIRRAFVATALAGASGWMLTGWVLGLSPSFLHEELNVRITRPVVSGLFAGLVLIANLVSQFAFRRYNTPRSLRTALVVMVAGMGIIASSSVVGPLGVALVGAVITGAGAGVVQMNTIATILRISPVHARGAVSSAFFTVAYVGMSVPVLIAGISADRFGLAVVADWYVVALAFVVVAAMVAARGQTMAWTSPPEDPVLVPAIAERRP